MEGKAMTDRTGTNAAGTEEAVAALYRFMQDMLVWEQKWDAIFKSDGIHASVPKASQELSEIYSRHLTQELMERDRKDGRLRSCAVGWPAEYSRDRETVERAELPNAGKVLITTLWRHPTSAAAQRNNRYTMVRKDGAWLLGKKERYRKIEGKWAKVTL